MYQTYRVVDLAPQRSDIKRKAQAQVSLSRFFPVTFDSNA